MAQYDMTPAEEDRARQERSQLARAAEEKALFERNAYELADYNRRAAGYTPPTSADRGSWDDEGRPGPQLPAGMDASRTDPWARNTDPGMIRATGNENPTSLAIGTPSTENPGQVWSGSGWTKADNVPKSLYMTDSAIQQRADIANTQYITSPDIARVGVRDTAGNLTGQYADNVAFENAAGRAQGQTPPTGYDLAAYYKAEENSRLKSDGTYAKVNRSVVYSDVGFSNTALGIALENERVGGKQDPTILKKAYGQVGLAFPSNIDMMSGRNTVPVRSDGEMVYNPVTGRTDFVPSASKYVNIPSEGMFYKSTEHSGVYIPGASIMNTVSGEVITTQKVREGSMLDNIAGSGSPWTAQSGTVSTKPNAAVIRKQDWARYGEGDERGIDLNLSVSNWREVNANWKDTSAPGDNLYGMIGGQSLDGRVLDSRQLSRADWFAKEIASRESNAKSNTQSNPMLFTGTLPFTGLILGGVAQASMRAPKDSGNLVNFVTPEGMNYEKGMNQTKQNVGLVDYGYKSDNVLTDRHVGYTQDIPEFILARPEPKATIYKQAPEPSRLESEKYARQYGGSLINNPSWDVTKELASNAAYNKNADELFADRARAPEFQTQTWTEPQGYSLVKNPAYGKVTARDTSGDLLPRAEPSTAPTVGSSGYSESDTINIASIYNIQQKPTSSRVFTTDSPMGVVSSTGVLLKQPVESFAVVTNDQSTVSPFKLGGAPSAKESIVTAQPSQLKYSGSPIFGDGRDEVRSERYASNIPIFSSIITAASALDPVFNAAGLPGVKESVDATQEKYLPTSKAEKLSFPFNQLTQYADVYKVESSEGTPYKDRSGEDFNPVFIGADNKPTKQLAFYGTPNISKSATGVTTTTPVTTVDLTGAGEQWVTPIDRKYTSIGSEFSRRETGFMDTTFGSILPREMPKGVAIAGAAITMPSMIPGHVVSTVTGGSSPLGFQSEQISAWYDKARNKPSETAGNVAVGYVTGAAFATLGEGFAYGSKLATAPGASASVVKATNYLTTVNNKVLPTLFYGSMAVGGVAETTNMGTDFNQERMEKRAAGYTVDTALFLGGMKYGSKVPTQVFGTPVRIAETTTTTKTTTKPNPEYRDMAEAYPVDAIGDVYAGGMTIKSVPRYESKMVSYADPITGKTHTYESEVGSPTSKAAEMGYTNYLEFGKLGTKTVPKEITTTDVTESTTYRDTRVGGIFGEGGSYETAAPRIKSAMINIAEYNPGNYRTTITPNERSGVFKNDAYTPSGEWKGQVGYNANDGRGWVGGSSGKTPLGEWKGYSYERTGVLKDEGLIDKLNRDISYDKKSNPYQYPAMKYEPLNFKGGAMVSTGYSPVRDNIVHPDVYGTYSEIYSRPRSMKANVGQVAGLGISLPMQMSGKVISSPMDSMFASGSDAISKPISRPIERPKPSFDAVSSGNLRANSVFRSWNTRPIEPAVESKSFVSSRSESRIGSSPSYKAFTPVKEMEMFKSVNTNSYISDIAARSDVMSRSRSTDADLTNTYSDTRGRSDTVSRMVVKPSILARTGNPALAGVLSVPMSRSSVRSVDTVLQNTRTVATDKIFARSTATETPAASTAAKTKTVVTTTKPTPIIPPLGFDFRPGSSQPSGGGNRGSGAHREVIGIRSSLEEFFGRKRRR